MKHTWARRMLDWLYQEAAERPAESPTRRLATSGGSPSDSTVAPPSAEQPAAVIHSASPQPLPPAEVTPSRRVDAADGLALQPGMPAEKLRPFEFSADTIEADDKLG